MRQHLPDQIRLVYPVIVAVPPVFANVMNDFLGKHDDCIVIQSKLF